MFIPGPDQLSHFRHWDRVGSRFGISIDCHLCLCRTDQGWVRYLSPANPSQKICAENALNNRHGDFCESGIRVCPESVGVGRFCRLRLRLREKQPTPTDSDSDSDSAALYGSIWIMEARVSLALPRPKWLTRDLMGGPKDPPVGFSPITQIRLGISL